MSERDPNEIGALWEKTSRGGTTFLSGTINGQAIVAFRNRSQNPKVPAWRVLKSEPRPVRTEDEPEF
jgi:uncharacterized protein (DUF736 family)